MYLSMPVMLRVEMKANNVTICNPMTSEEFGKKAKQNIASRGRRLIWIG